MAAEHRLWPSGEQEMARLIRAHDWAATALGPIETWPQSLKQAVELTLAAPFASVLLWGPDFIIAAYNCGYRAILNRKPEALGRPVLDVWAEERELLAPQLARVLGGETLFFKELPMSLKRGLESDEAWFDYGYSPVRDETGSVRGILVTINEITGWMDTVQKTRENQTRQEFSLRLSDVLRSLSDAVQIRGETVRLLRAHYDAGWCCYCEFDRTQKLITVAQCSVRDGLPSLAGRHDFSDMPELLAHWQAGEIVSIEDFQASLLLSPRAKKLYAATGISAFLGVPVLKNGVLIAALVLADTTPHAWPQSIAHVVADSAERTWAAVERARAEEALRESETRYRTLFEAIDSGFCIFEMIFDDNGRAVDYRFVEVNPAFERQSGLVDAVGRRIREFAPDLEEHWFERYGRVALTGEPMRIEGEVAPLGRWFDINAFRVGAPEQHRVAALFTDISARKEAEEAIRESEERQAFLLKLSDALRHIADPDTIQYEACHLLANRLNVDRAFYVEIDEAVGVARVARDFVRDGAQSLAGTHRLVDYGWSISILRRGEWYAISDTQASDLVPKAERPASAAVQLIASIGVPLIKDERLVGALCVTEGRPRDWSEVEVDLVREVGERIWSAVERARAEEALRKNEARLALALQSGSIGVFDYKIANGVIGWDPMLRDIWGVGQDDPITYETFESGLHIDDRERVNAAVQASLDPRNGRYDAEYRVINRRTGRIYWLNASGTVTFEGGKPLRMIGVARDVSAQKQANALNEEQAELLELIARGRPLYITLTAITASVKRLLPSVRCAVLLADENRDRFPAAYSETIPPTFAESIKDAPIDGLCFGTCGEAVFRGQPVRCGDVANDLRWSEPWRELCIAHGIRACYSHPVTSPSGKALASVFFAFSEPRDPTPEELNIADLCARIASIAIVRSRAHRLLQESEEKFRSLAETVPQIVWMSDDRTVEYFNNRWFSYTGMDGDSAVDHNWAEAIHPDDRVAAMQSVEEAHKTGLYEAQYRLRRADGQYRWHVARSVRVPGLDRWIGTATDIDDIKRAQTELQESEDRFRGFAENSSDTLWILNAASRKLEYLSPSFEAMFGVSRNAILSNISKWGELVHPDDRELAKKALPTVLDGEKSVSITYRIVLPDGTVKWINDTGFAILGENGRLERVGGISKDITQRMHIEERLRASEARLAAVLDQLPVGVGLIDWEGRFVLTNPVLKRYAGNSIPSRDSVHKSKWRAIDGDGQDIPALDWPAARALRGETVVPGIEMTYTGDDGVLRWMLVSAAPFLNESGQPKEAITVVQDIDALKRADHAQQVLIRELQHRTRNLITVVNAIATQTAETSPSLEVFLDKFTDRLIALSRVQSLFSQRADDITLRELVMMEIDALGSDGERARMSASGPDIPLPRRVIQMLSLALHELATNALKYGAFSTPEGRLNVHWCKQPHGNGGGENSLLVLTWEEQGSESSPQPFIHRGYGRELIEEALPYQISAETAMEMTPHGLKCVIRVPLDQV